MAHELLAKSDHQLGMCLRIEILKVRISIATTAIERHAHH